MRHPADNEKTDGGLRDYLFKVDPQITPPSLKRYIQDAGAAEPPVVSPVTPQAAPQAAARPSAPVRKLPRQQTPPAPSVAPQTPSVPPRDHMVAVEDEIQQAIGSADPVSPSPPQKPKPTPDSAAKITFLHTFFDRIEKTVRDLKIEDSEGRAAEAFRERAVRLVSSLSDVLPMDSITSGSALNIDSAFPVVYKSPQSVKRVIVDWSQWIDGQTIKSSSWTCPDLQLANTSFSDDRTTVFVGGGELEKTYTLTNRISDSSGRIEERSVTISVKQT
jgi:hypothetical protein